MKCLIVENNAQDRALLKRMLKKFGLADLAENGEVAVSMFQASHSENDPYDIIFLDIMMPGMDGNEVLRLIRKWENQNIPDGNPVHVVMASSKTDTDTIIQSYDDGCQHFFMKPYEQLELNDLMSKLGFQEPM